MFRPATPTRSPPGSRTSSASRGLARLRRAGAGALRGAVQPPAPPPGARRRRRARARRARGRANSAGAGGKIAMSVLSIPKEWRRLALVLGGEGMQSGLHFALNLALIALLPRKEYGAFAFTLVLGGVGLVYVRALDGHAGEHLHRQSRRAAPCRFLRRRVRRRARSRLAPCGGGLRGDPVDRRRAARRWAARRSSGSGACARICAPSASRAARLGAVTLGDAAFASTGVAASVVALRFDADRLQGVLLALALANIAGAARSRSARGVRPARRFRTPGAALLPSRSPAAGLVALQRHRRRSSSARASRSWWWRSRARRAFAPIAAMLAFFAPLRIFSMSLANMVQPESPGSRAAGDEAGWRALRAAWTLRACALALIYGNRLLRCDSASASALAGGSARDVRRGLGVVAVRGRARLSDAANPAGDADAVPRHRGDHDDRRDVSLGADGLLLLVARAAYSLFGGVLGEGVAAAATWRWRRGRSAPRPRCEISRRARAGRRTQLSKRGRSHERRRDVEISPPTEAKPYAGAGEASRRAACGRWRRTTSEPVADLFLQRFPPARPSARARAEIAECMKALYLDYPFARRRGRCAGGGRSGGRVGAFCGGVRTRFQFDGRPAKACVTGTLMASTAPGHAPAAVQILAKAASSTMISSSPTAPIAPRWRCVRRSAIRSSRGKPGMGLRVRA